LTRLVGVERQTTGKARKPSVDTLLKIFVIKAVRVISLVEVVEIMEVERWRGFRLFQRKS